MWLLWRKRGIQTILLAVGEYHEIKKYLIEGGLLQPEVKVERFRLEKWVNGDTIIARFGGKKFRNWGDILQRMKEIDDGP